MVCDDAEHRALPGLGVELGRLEQRLGRDAAPDQAGAAHAVLLDDGRLGPELSRPERGDVATRAAADHDYVKGPGHSSCLYLISMSIMAGPAFTL